MRNYSNEDFLVITELKVEYDDLPVYNHTLAKILVEYNAAVSTSFICS